MYKKLLGVAALAISLAGGLWFSDNSEFLLAYKTISQPNTQVAGVEMTTTTPLPEVDQGKVLGVTTGVALAATAPVPCGDCIKPSPTSYNLIVSKSGTGSGTVTSSIVGISCGADCSQAYTSGTSVTLTAVAASGSTFGGWGDTCSSTTTTCAFVISSTKTITATFKITPIYTLTAFPMSQTQIGLVWRSTVLPADSSGYKIYRNNSLVATITGESNYQYDASGGARYYYNDGSLTCGTTYNYYMQGVASSVKSNIVSVATDSCVSATPTLYVTKTGTGSGTVFEGPILELGSVINCGSLCSTTFLNGVVVTLNATPTTGSIFTGWSGDCTGIGPCTLTMNSNKNVAATFVSSITSGVMAVLNSTSVSATLTPGQTDVTMSKVDLQISNSAPVYLSGVKVGNDANILAGTLKNIKVYLDGVQLGNTITNLISTGEYNYGQISFNPIILSAATTKTLVIKADVDSAAVGTVRLGVWGLNFSGASPTVTGLPVKGPIMTIGGNTSPSLTVQLAGDTPPSSTVLPGQTSVAFTKIKLSAVGGDVGFTQIGIQADPASATIGLSNIKVYDDTGNILGTLVQLSDLPPQGWISLIDPYIIPSNSSKVFTIKSDITAEASGTLRLTLGGLVYSSILPPTVNWPWPLWGNTMTVSTISTSTDLTISNIVARASYPVPDPDLLKQFETVVIKNSGTTNFVGTVEYQVKDNLSGKIAPQLSYTFTENLPLKPGEEMYIEDQQLNYFSNTGKYEFVAVLDPQNKIKELNENNNTLTKTITVDTVIVQPKTMTAQIAGNYAFKMKWYRSVAGTYMFNARNMIDLTESVSVGATSIKTSVELDPNKNYVIFDSDSPHAEKLDVDPSSSGTVVKLHTPLGGKYTASASSKTKIATLLGIYVGWCPTVIDPIDLGYYNAGEEILIGQVTNYYNDVLEPKYSNNPEFFYVEQNSDGKYEAVIDEGKHLGGWKAIGVKSGYDDGGFEVYHTSTPASKVTVPLPVYGTNQTPYCAFNTDNSSPVIKSVNGSQTLAVNQVGLWTIKASDVDSTSLLYEVNFGEPWLYPGPIAEYDQTAPPETNVKFSHKYENPGNFTIWFWVLDKNNPAVSKTYPVKVTIVAEDSNINNTVTKDELINQAEITLQARIKKLEYRVSELEQQLVEAEKKLVLQVDKKLTNRVAGKIILQVESHGEAWYVDKDTQKKFYLKDGTTAYTALRAFGLGITNKDLAKIPVGLAESTTQVDTDNDGLVDNLENAIGTDANNKDSDQDGYLDGEEILNGYSPLGINKVVGDNGLTNRVTGKILLQVESHGEAWYVFDGKRYYMGDGDSAYQIMRSKSLGITNNDLRKIEVGEFE